MAGNWTLAQAIGAQDVTPSGITVSPGLGAPSAAGTTLVAWLNSTNNTWTVPAGWILGTAEQNNGAQAAIAIYPNNPGGISSATFTNGGTSNLKGIMGEFVPPTGVTNAGLKIQATGAAGAADHCSVIAGTAQAGDLILCGFDESFPAGTAITWHDPSGFTLAGSDQGSGAANHQYAGYNLNAASGALTVTGSSTPGTTKTPGGWAGVVVTVGNAVVIPARPFYDATPAGWLALQASVPTPLLLSYGPAWTAAQIATIPAATVKLPLDNDGTHPLTTAVIDVETGDVTSASVIASWISTKNAQPGGYAANRPTVYMNIHGLYYLGAANDVITPLKNTYGLNPGVDYDLWLASTTGVVPSAPISTLGVPCVATQWANYAQTGHQYDENVAWDATWHPTTTPPVPTGVTNIQGAVVLVYAPVAALGKLVASIAPVAGTDSFGNAYPAGVASIGAAGNMTAVMDDASLVLTKLAGVLAPPAIDLNDDTTGGGSTLAVTGLTVAVATVANLLRGQVIGDSGQRIIIDQNGKVTWGSGTGAGDTDLYRDAPGGAPTLTTDQAAAVKGTLAIGGPGTPATNADLEVHSLVGLAAKTAPATPPAGYGYLYVNSSNGSLHYKGPSGTDTQIAPA